MTVTTTPLSRDINTVIAADTPLLVVRPTVDQSLTPAGNAIKTVRGGNGTLQNQDGGGTVRLDYSNEAFFGTRGSGLITIAALVADAQIYFGPMIPQAFVPGDVDIALDTIDLTAHGYVTGDGPVQITSDDQAPAGFGTQATGNLDITTEQDNGTVTIDGKVYTFNTVVGTADGDVLIGADTEASIFNLVSAINLDGGDPAIYATAMTLHPSVTAAEGALDTMDVTAKSGGVEGNLIDTTETLTTAAWGGAVLSGGAEDDGFIIVVDVDTIQMAGTRQNALDGVAVDFTSTGVGNLTVTGIHNASFVAPAASILDGSAGLVIELGEEVTIPMGRSITILSDTNGAVTFQQP